MPLQEQHMRGVLTLNPSKTHFDKPDDAQEEEQHQHAEHQDEMEEYATGAAHAVTDGGRHNAVREGSGYERSVCYCQWLLVDGELVGGCDEELLSLHAGSGYILEGGEPVAYPLARCIVTGESAAVVIQAGRTVQVRESLDARERGGDRGNIVNGRYGARGREITRNDIVSDMQQVCGRRVLHLHHALSRHGRMRLPTTLRVWTQIS